MLGYSGNSGGSLNIQSGPIRIGGKADAGLTSFNSDFFTKGGFSQYSLTGIGQAITSLDSTSPLGSYVPGLHIAENAIIRPIAESLIAYRSNDSKGSIIVEKYLK
jgi:hypothetical protein